MVAIKAGWSLVLSVITLLLLLGSSLADHGSSYVSVHNHGGKYKYEYKIHHGKHGHWSGHAHPHGYGGFGEKHYR